MADLSELNRELHCSAPQDFSRLEEAEVQLLTDCLRSTKKRQHSQLRQSMEAALSHIPALLRGPVKRILLGR